MASLGPDPSQTQSKPPALYGPHYLQQLSKENENKGFILKHSVGNYPGKSDIDVPLNYADYYYLEALNRYSELKKLN